MEREFPFGTFRPVKQDNLFRHSFAPEFSTGTTRKVVYHLRSNRNFWNGFVNGKQPGFTLNR